MSRHQTRKDNQVALASLASRDRSGRSLVDYLLDSPAPTGWLPTAAPPLANEITRIVEALHAPSCALPGALPTDVSGFPSRFMTQLDDVTVMLPSTCYVVRRAQGPALPRVGSINVLMKAEPTEDEAERTAYLTSSFRTEAGRIVLSEVRAIRGETPTRTRRHRRW